MSELGVDRGGAGVRGKSRAWSPRKAGSCQGGATPSAALLHWSEVFLHPSPERFPSRTQV